jgi:hypothetical protein
VNQSPGDENKVDELEQLAGGPGATLAALFAVGKIVEMLAEGAAKGR